MSVTINNAKSSENYEITDLGSEEKRSQYIDNGFTSFIGKGFPGDLLQLFLVTYSGVVRASNFSQTWNQNDKWFIKKRVDIDISIKE